MSASQRKSTQVHARPGQTESKVDPSFQYASTCDSVWSGLNTITVLGVWQSYIKQLLDEVEHDIKNYQTRGLCYLPKPKAEADNRHVVLIIHDIMRKPNSIIVLLYIFLIIHPQKQKQSVQPFCFWGEHSKGLSNQADVELDMINAISAADIAFIMSSSHASYCELIESSRPIRFSIVNLMYNNNI